MRICAVTNDICHPLDEGFKKSITAIVQALRGDHDLLVAGANLEPGLGHNFCTNRMLLSRRLRREIRLHRPDCLLYLPMSSLTLASFVRARILKHYAPASRSILVGFQPRQFGPMARRLIPMLSPGIVCVQSRASAERLRAMGLVARSFRSGVDAEKFSPVGEGQKRVLRNQLGLPMDRRIVLHVGHLNRSRGLDVVVGLGGKNTLPVIVGSTSTQCDSGYAQELRSRGTYIISAYSPNIEDYFRSADVYVFPTISVSSAIEFPLSVLEALACGVPVLSTRFGALGDFFQDSPWFRFFDNTAHARQQLTLLLNLSEPERAAMVAQVRERFSWGAVARELLSN